MNTNKTTKKSRFDYSKIEAEEDPREYWEYFGILPKNGHIRIDTKRLKKVAVEEGTIGELDSAIFQKPRNSVYLIPVRLHRYDYKVNLMRDLLSSLQKEWYQEYKPLLGKIETPKDVYEQSRLDGIATTSCADDLDDIEFEATMAGIRRQPQYLRAVQSLYCQFVEKICCEIDRFSIILMNRLGYEGNDFSTQQFLSFSEGLKAKSNGKSFSNLKYWADYDALHKINNFIKHNTEHAYMKVRKNYPNYLVQTKKKYVSGMFAGDWIYLPDDFIEEILKHLTSFFEDYCASYLDENIEEAKWNYEDYFKEYYKKVKNLWAYFGV